MTTQTTKPAAARILVVEDTPANIQMLSATLKAAGYQVSVATNGRQALDVVARLTPDLILMDIVMPEMDGFEACRVLKDSSEWRAIPIIFLTSRAETDDIVKGFELGAVDYLAKPFNAHELLARVNTHLTVDELRRTLAESHAALERAHELVRRAFGRYVSEEVAESLLTSPEGLKLGGEEREVTILMSDLRGFTALTSRLRPQEVIECLNIFLAAAVEVIGEFQGTIDEIIGDAILVIFGAPVPSEDHADRAVACGIALQRMMTRVNERLAGIGIEPLEMGVGIHSGPVIVGNIGSERRTKYAAVGENVNLTGRIESFTTGGQVLISEETRRRVTAELVVDAEFQVEPKGASRSVRLFDVSGIGAPYGLRIEERSHALQPLDTPVAVSFTVLEEKFVGDTVHEGLLLAVSPSEADLRALLDVAPLSNLRLTVAGAAGAGAPAGEIYAKTLGGDAAAQRSRLRFTSVTPELREWMRAVCQGTGSSLLQEG
jgi:adenylate cyclase